MRVVDGEAGPVRILHLTDPHLLADTGGKLRGRVTYDCLRRVIDHATRTGRRNDLILVTGDLVQDDSREAYEHFRKLIRDLDAPVWCLPGNHDVRPLMQSMLRDEPFSYCAVTERGSWLIACLDSCIEGEVGGELSARELGRVQDALRESSAPFLLFALHHPPVPVGSRWLDETCLRNGQAFLEFARNTGKPSVTVFGHVHQAFDADHGSMRILGTPSTCRQFRRHSDSYAVDDLPPAYRRLSLLPDGGIETEVVWID